MLNESAQRYDTLIFNPLMRQYYGSNGYFNVGYWDAGISTQKQACDNLVDRLARHIPNQAELILDAACGLGATTNHIAALHPSARVIGVNLSARQVEHCRQAVPGCQFLQMDATRMGLRDLVFDAVLCVEAAFHFHTRRDFLREAWRMLKPGGYLVLTDILFRSEQWAGAWTVPRENYVADLNAYREIIADAGFDSIVIEDATEVCWVRCWREVKHWVDRQYRAGELDVGLWTIWMRVAAGLGSGAEHYLIMSARKDQGAR
jgi:SAM-dependent methyltransferase